MTLRTARLLAVLVIATVGLQGCAYVAVAAVGAAGGYMAKKEGYSLRSPVAKESPARD